MADANPTTPELEFALKVISEAANRAYSINKLCIEAVNSEPNTAALLADAAADQASMLGYIADMATRKLGELQNKGDAKEWLLSPVLAEALDSLEAHQALIAK